MRVRLFKRFGQWHYYCPCCPERPTPVPHWSYGVMLKAANAHIDTYHWRRPQPRLGDPPTYADNVAAFADHIGTPLEPWQRRLLADAYDRCDAESYRLNNID